MGRVLAASCSLYGAQALACAVCGAGQDPNDGTWLVMTAILSLLPLLAIGGITGWVALRLRRHAREEAAAASGSAAPATAPAP